MEDGRAHLPPPAPHDQPRVNRPRRDWRFRLKFEAWEAGPQGLISLGESLFAAGYEVAPQE
eukprot:8729151-Karenia_brevis.AAC.1